MKAARTCLAADLVAGSLGAELVVAAAVAVVEPAVVDAAAAVDTPAHPEQLSVVVGTAAGTPVLAVVAGTEM